MKSAEVDQSQGKGKPAEQVHPNLAKGVVDGLGRASVTDEGKGAHRGELPGTQQPGEVVTKHDGKHRGEKEEHEGKKGGAPVGGAGSLFGGVLLRVLLEVAHVTKRVDADA